MKSSKPIRNYNKLVCIKESLALSYWFDSGSAVYYDNYIHIIGSADRAVYPTSMHLVLDKFGNIIYNITAPFIANSELNLSLLNGKIYAIGGTNGISVWVFDPTVSGYAAGSWSEVNADFTAAIGERKMAWGTDYNGWFYIGGGWSGTNVYKTQNFTSWTFCANLPSQINKLSGCGCCVFNNKIYIIGGGANQATNDFTGFYESEVNGYVYSFDPLTNTFNQVYQNQEHFGQTWLDAVSNNKYMYVIKGYIYPASISAQYPGGTNAVPTNNRGVLRSEDGVTWESLDLQYGHMFLSERHRASVVNVGDIPYIIAGFGSKDVWTIV